MTADTPQHGLFLVLEGVEGAGKTTQAELLRHRFRVTEVAHTVSREPGGTRLGEGIRELLLERVELDIPIESELLLMLGARAAFIQQVVRPALERGEVVLSDRFELSTFAYQGFGRGIDLNEVRRLNRFSTGGIRPDLTLILDVPVGHGLARQRGAGKEQDRFEGGGDVFLERVREGYRTLSQEDERVLLLDGSLPSEVVHEEIVSLLAGRFPGRFPETFSDASG